MTGLAAVRRIRGGIAAVLAAFGVAGIALIAIVLRAGISGGTPTCTNTWTGTTGGSFFTTSRWSAGHVPKLTEYACIPSTVTGVVRFDTGADATFGGLDAEGAGFSITAGTLKL